MKNKMKLVSYYTNYGNKEMWDSNSPIKCVCDEHIFSNTRERKQVLDKYYYKLIEIEPELEEYFKSTCFNRSNMFICKKEIYDKYCKWLFSLIIPLCNEFIKEDLSCGKIRMLGYLSERLLTYWINKNNLKIKELQCVITGDKI